MNNRKTRLDNHTVRQRVRRITLISLLANLLLSGFKFVAGLLGGSQALVADAIHSLSDSSTDIAILLGVPFWSAPPDEEHPYGHWRIETLVTTAIGGLLVLIAVGICIRSFQNIRIGTAKAPAWFTLGGALASMLVKEVLFRWTLRTGRAIHSSSVVANAWHHRSDALSSIPAAVAILASRLRPEWAYIDQAGAIVVSGFILYAAFNIMKSAAADLIDASASETVLNKIQTISQGIEGVASIHAVRTRRLGPGYHLDLHVQVHGSLSVSAGHNIAGEVKRQLMDQLPEIRDVIVHIEPA